MKRAAYFVVCALVASVTFASDTITISVHGASVIQIAGATAAYAVDPSIADANVVGDIVSVTGRSAGTTQIVIVTAGGSATYTVVVRAREGTRIDKGRVVSPNRASVEARYSTTELQNSVEMVRESGATKTELRATVVANRTKSSLDGGGSRATFRFLTWRSTSPGRELTLFDDTVDLSPLTLQGTNVRGIHLRQGALELHAGNASTPIFGSLFTPEQRDLAAGVSYTLRRGAGSSWTPSVYAFPGQGPVASLRYDTSRGEVFSMMAEAGWGGVFGGAVQIASNRPHDRARLDVVYRPR
ncbi:MAG TPA: pilus assembly protein N-terminal domain-containing protein, partial [Thermoanaerobaculia bacterium]|nr:pilus assembly protein N-terminal domain-containing protein [Thermoanaerobaculia bacterium]